MHNCLPIQLSLILLENNRVLRLDGLAGKDSLSNGCHLLKITQKK